MRYYSEEDVISIMRAVESSVMAYEWGCGNTDVNMSDYPSIEIPESHGDLIDKNYLKNNVSYGGDPELGEFDMVMWDDVENAPIVIRANS